MDCLVQGGSLAFGPSNGQVYKSQLAYAVLCTYSTHKYEIVALNFEDWISKAAATWRNTTSTTILVSKYHLDSPMQRFLLPSCVPRMGDP
jgi:hypothetical protein